MTSKVGKQAPFLAGIPVVASTAERDSLYPSPDTNQRVQNLGSGYFERWNGATWVQDIATGVGAGGVYSVKSYGAIGDGDTDDTTACQNALNAADLAGVGAVVVPPGTYKLTAALTPGSGTTFLGQGGFLRQHTEAANVVTVASKSNVALVNLDVGYNTSTVRNTTNGLSVQTCTDVEISGCRVRNGPGLGIYVANSQRARVHDNHIHSMLADGIHVTNGSSTGHVSKDVTVSGNVVEGTGTTVSPASPTPRAGPRSTKASRSRGTSSPTAPREGSRSRGARASPWPGTRSATWPRRPRPGSSRSSTTT
jgi:hypothetical protein